MDLFGIWCQPYRRFWKKIKSILIFTQPRQNPMREGGNCSLDTVCCLLVFKPFHRLPQKLGTSSDNEPCRKDDFLFLVWWQRGLAIQPCMYSLDNIHTMDWIAVMQKQGDNAGKTKGLNILNENQPLIQISDDGVTHAFFEWQQIASKIWVHCSIKQSSLHAAIVVVSNLIFFNLPRI